MPKMILDEIRLAFLCGWESCHTHMNYAGRLHCYPRDGVENLVEIERMYKDKENTVSKDVENETEVKEALEE